MNSNHALTRIRLLIAFFIFALAISGITAIPLVWEVDVLRMLVSASWSPVPTFFPGLAYWIERVAEGLYVTYQQYPFMAYGTDWLAFGHIIIAIMFIGPLKDPVKNVWVIDAGMAACILVVVWSLIFGPLRGIPFFWSLVDSSFGAFGIIPLWLCRRMIG